MNEAALEAALAEGDTLLRASRDFPAAEAAFLRALQLDGRHLGATWGLGLACGLQNRPLEAVNWFRRAIEIDPDCAPAHFQLGVTLLYLGDRDGALAEYDVVREIAPALVPAFESILEELTPEGG